MPTTQSQTAVAARAAHWDVGDVRLWESTDPGVVLHAPRTLRLARDGAGRPVAAVTRYLHTVDTELVPTGGAVTLDLTDTEPPDPAARAAREAEWTRTLLSDGYAGAGELTGPRYLPLPIRQGSLSAQLDPSEGRVSGEPGGTTLRLDLTAAGITAWVAALAGHGSISGTVRLSSSYPRLMPTATAVATLHGRRCYAVLAEQLTVAADGELVGTSDNLARGWTELVATGAVEVSFSGLPEADLESARDGLLDQVRAYLFDNLFDPRAAAGSAQVRFAFKWKKAGEVPDLPLSVSVGGCTWLTGSRTASLAELVAVLGPEAVHDVHESVSASLPVWVEACDLVEQVQVSLDFGEMRPPETFTVGRAGGSRVVAVTTRDLARLSVRQRTRVTYTDPAFPVTVDESTLGPPGPEFEVRVRPQDGVGELQVYFASVEGDRLGGWRPGADAATATLTVSHPQLARPFTTSGALEHDEVTVLRFPVRPGLPPGTVTLAVTGTVGDRLVRGSRDLTWDPGTTMALLEGGVLRFVTASDPAPESGGAAELRRRADGRVVVGRAAPTAAEAVRPLTTLLDVPLVPQPTPSSAWAAALAMLLTARDGRPVSAADAAARAGLSLDVSYDWDAVRGAVARCGLVAAPCPGPDPATWSTLLRTAGPGWLLRPRTWFCGVVVVGVTGDGTQDGTWARVAQPWPVRIGSLDTRLLTTVHDEFRPTATEPSVLVHR